MSIKAGWSTGRVGLKVCDDAGWGDIGYFSRWTWEMRNDNDEAIIIPVGERLAQIVFFQTGDPREGESYGVEKLYQSKYQDTDDVDDQVGGAVRVVHPDVAAGADRHRHQVRHVHLRREVDAARGRARGGRARSGGRSTTARA